jgi:hypothetical protein
MLAVEQPRIARTGSGNAIRFGRHSQDEFREIVDDFDFLPAENPNKRHLVDIAYSASERIMSLLEVLTSLPGADELQIATEWHDYGNFNAEVSPPRDGVFRITMNLGTLPHLFGMAHRLCKISDGKLNVVRLLMMAYGRSGFAKDRVPWDPLRDPIGDIVEIHGECAESHIPTLVDSVSLLWLHECAHVLAGHQFAKKIQNPFWRRAAEYEADYGAGYLLMEGYLRSRTGTSNEELATLTKRCVNAAVVCFLCTRVTSVQHSQQYHLPPVRLSAFLEGMARAWKANGYEAWTFSNAREVALQRSSGLIASLFEIYHQSWTMPDHPENQNDRHYVERFTKPLIEHLRRELKDRRAAAVWDTAG